MRKSAVCLRSGRALVRECSVPLRHKLCGGCVVRRGATEKEAGTGGSVSGEIATRIDTESVAANPMYAHGKVEQAPA